MGVALFRTAPTSEAVRAFLGHAIHCAGRSPKYIVCDRGPQFWCPGFKSWCRRRKIKPRFGAVGQHGSIAVIVGIHPHAENDLHAGHSGPRAAREDARGAPPIRQLVQRPPPAHDARGRHARRGVPPAASNLPLPALRATPALAARFALRQPARADSRAAGPAAGTAGRVPGPSEAPSDRDTSARGVCDGAASAISRAGVVRPPSVRRGPATELPKNGLFATPAEQS